MDLLLAAKKAHGVWPQWLIFSIYTVAILAIAIYTRKKSKSVNEFMFANKNVGGWLSAFSYGTTYFSAVVFIGFAGKTGWTYGFSSIWIGIGNAIFGTLLAWLVLAKRTKFMTSKLNAKTMPEFFEKRYDSKYIKLFSALIIFVFLVPYSASVYQGMGYMFEKTLGLKAYYCILILAILTSIYLFIGGYFATTLTDFIQGIIMIFGLITVIGVLFGRNGESKIPEHLANFNFSGSKGFIPHGKGKFFESPLFNISILTLLTSFGIWGLPQSIHKFYAIKDESEIKKGTIISTVFAAIIGVGAYLMGALVSVAFSDSQVQNIGIDKLVPTMLLGNLPSALFGLIMVLLFSASMSTLAALSLSSSSTITIDIINGYGKKKLKEKQTNIVLRVFCLVFVGVSAILAGFQVQAIVTLMALGWGAIAGCFIGPYVYGLFWKKTNKAGAYASFVTGLLLTLILTFVFGAVKTPVGARTFSKLVKNGVSQSPIIGVITMIASMVVTPMFSAIFKNIDNTPDVDKLFVRSGDIMLVESDMSDEQDEDNTNKENEINDEEKIVEDNINE